MPIGFPRDKITDLNVLRKRHPAIAGRGKCGIEAILVPINSKEPMVKIGLPGVTQEISLISSSAHQTLLSALGSADHVGPLEIERSAEVRGAPAHFPGWDGVSDGALSTIAAILDRPGADPASVSQAMMLWPDDLGRPTRASDRTWGATGKGSYLIAYCSSGQAYHPRKRFEVLNLRAMKFARSIASKDDSRDDEAVPFIHHLQGDCIIIKVSNIDLKMGFLSLSKVISFDGLSEAVGSYPLQNAREQSWLDRVLAKGAGNQGHALGPLGTFMEVQPPPKAVVDGQTGSHLYHVLWNRDGAAQTALEMLYKPDDLSSALAAATKASKGPDAKPPEIDTDACAQFLTEFVSDLQASLPLARAAMSHLLHEAAKSAKSDSERQLEMAQIRAIGKEILAMNFEIASDIGQQRAQLSKLLNENLELKTRMTQGLQLLGDRQTVQLTQPAGHHQQVAVHHDFAHTPVQFHPQMMGHYYPQAYNPQLIQAMTQHAAMAAQAQAQQHGFVMNSHYGPYMQGLAGHYCKPAGGNVPPGGGRMS